MRKIVLTLLLILVPVASSLAAPAELYTGVVEVESQQASERKQALPMALLQVLQKLSGLRQIDDAPLFDYQLLDNALNSADSILVSFHYRNEEKTLADGSVITNLRLVARFSEPDVNELARTLQLPLWRPERQAMEIWVVVDDGLDRRIMPIEFAYAWDAMDEAASSRGMPLVWPQADEEGNYPVDEQLLWGGYTEDLSEQGHGAVMVAAARREGPDWSVRFNLAYGNQNWTWRNRGVDLQWVLRESIEESVDRVAEANTIAAADQGKRLHELTVTGITNADDYARCLAYLQSLSVIDRVTVGFAQAGLVRFKLELNALPQYLKEVLSGSSVLEFIESQSSYLLSE